MFKRPANVKNSKEMYRVKGLGCQGPMLYYGIIRHLQMLDVTAQGRDRTTTHL